MLSFSRFHVSCNNCWLLSFCSKVHVDWTPWHPGKSFRDVHPRNRPQIHQVWHPPIDLDIMANSGRRLAVISLISLWRINGKPPRGHESTCSTETFAPQIHCVGVPGGDTGHPQRHPCANWSRTPWLVVMLASWRHPFHLRDQASRREVLLDIICCLSSLFSTMLLYEGFGWHLGIQALIRILRIL